MKRLIEDQWFLNDLEAEEKLRWFDNKPRESQLEDFFKASMKEAKKQAGQRDIYAADPFMVQYLALSRDRRRAFNARNNCAAWATGNIGGERLMLPGGKILCPQLGDSLGVPFSFLDGKPSSKFPHLARARRLSRLDGLEPVRVGKTDVLPVQRPDQRLIGIGLFKSGDGFDTHCVTRAPGSEFFSHKLGTVLPPSMLDTNGLLIRDPRKANFGDAVSRWMFFTAPAHGVTHTHSAEVREQVKAFTQLAAQDRKPIATALAAIVATRSPALAKRLLKND